MNRDSVTLTMMSCDANEFNRAVNLCDEESAKTIAAHEKEIDELTEMNSALKHELSMALSEKQDSITNGELQRENQKLGHMVRELKEKKQEMEKCMARLEKQLHDRDVEIDDLSHDESQALKENEQLKEEIANLERKNKILEHNANSHEKVHMRKKIAELTDQLKDSARQIKDLQLLRGAEQQFNSSIAWGLQQQNLALQHQLDNPKIIKAQRKAARLIIGDTTEQIKALTKAFKAFRKENKVK